MNYSRTEIHRIRQAVEECVAHLLPTCKSAVVDGPLPTGEWFLRLRFQDPQLEGSGRGLDGEVVALRREYEFGWRNLGLHQMALVEKCLRRLARMRSRAALRLGKAAP